MKKMKKVFAMLLAFAMVMGMSLTTFAADGIVGNSDDTGSITVSNVEKGVTVRAYQIVEAKYVNDYFSGYEVVEGYSIADKYNPTQDELATIAASVDANGGYELEWQDASSNYFVDNVPVGTYLISVTGSDSVVYGLAIASIQYANKTGTTTIIDPADIDFINDATTWVKRSDAPDFSKVIIEDNTEKVENTVDVGDVVKYELTIDPVPYYGGNHPKLNVVDTLCAGLKYNDDLAVIIVEGNADGSDVALVKGTHYTLTPVYNEDGTTQITVNFVLDKVGYTLNNFVGKELIISYTATVDKDAVVYADDANLNTASLNYTTDSKKETETDPITDTTKTYTYNLTSNVLKTKEDGTTPLDGAVFGIYKDSTCKEAYTNTIITGNLTTADGGRLNLKGLDEGTYYLKEISAPAGYAVNTNVYEIKVTATKDNNGTINGYTVETKLLGAAEATENLVIKNTTISALPSTGGIGTAVFTIGGCAIMIAAAYFFFVSRKKEA